MMLRDETNFGIVCSGKETQQQHTSHVIIPQYSRLTISTDVHGDDILFMTYDLGLRQSTYDLKLFTIQYKDRQRERVIIKSVYWPVLQGGWFLTSSERLGLVSWYATSFSWAQHSINTDMDRIAHVSTYWEDHTDPSRYWQLDDKTANVTTHSM